MLDIKIEAMKGMFFDREAVLNAADAGTRKVFSKFGAYVRKGSRQSIKNRKTSSRPGEPPRSHTGLLKRNIFFGYDTSAKSVVIGPVLLNGKRGTAPESLEYGGPAVVVERKTKRKVTIKPRPYMQPAFDAELPKLPAMWANSIK